MANQQEQMGVSARVLICINSGSIRPDALISAFVQDVLFASSLIASHPEYVRRNTCVSLVRCFVEFCKRSPRYHKLGQMEEEVMRVCSRLGFDAQKICNDL